MEDRPIVSREEWILARRELLQKEKELTRLRDEVSRRRRELPWVPVEKAYVFDAPGGQKTLAELFDGQSQLLVYHYMFDPTWEAGCKSCAFWADQFNGIGVHLRHRDVTMLAISRAPLQKLEAFRARMGWSFTWVSSGGTDFNHDFGVSFTPEEIGTGQIDYNYGKQKPGPQDLPGVSVFYRSAGGQVFHTYSCYSRGIDMMNGAYHYLDLVPKGRDEGGLAYSMSWLRLHDRYEDG